MSGPPEKAVEALRRRTEAFMAMWLGGWAEASAPAVDRFVAAMSADGVYQASPFSIARGRDQIRRYMQMTLTQRNGHAGPALFMGALGDRGVATWAIEYDVAPKDEWPSLAPREAIDSDEWATYRALPIAPQGNRIRQEGIALVRFDADGLCAEFREWWDTKVLR